MKVPFIDLKEQHQVLENDLQQAMSRVLSRADFALGKDVALFEQEYADYCGSQYAIGVDSGLSALDLSLRALGVGPGDQVIVPAHTFIATAAAATFVGAEMVPVDVDLATYNISIEQIETAITPKTRAIIAVHLYGLPAPMAEILDIADRHGLVVIEDACQAHGATTNGHTVGSLGHAAAFSFYPTKNLGGCGDAGMVVTNDPRVDEQVRAMRNCGQRRKYYHELPPFNHRMDTLQAALLRVKLQHLDEYIAARQRNAALYAQLLAECEVITPVAQSESTHVYHLYVIRIPHRYALQAYLAERGIGTAIHYPVPVHLQPFYAGMGFRQGQFPITELISEEVLSLPMYPELREDQVRTVADAIAEFCALHEPRI